MEYKLSDVVNIKYGKSQKKVESKNGKFPIIGTGGIIGYATDYLYDKESVLIGRKGSIQNIYYMDNPFWTIDTLFYTEINNSIVIPKYLFYLLKTFDFMQYNEGTYIPSLRTQTLNEIVLDIPCINQQEKTVGLLNSLDKKIEVNNKIIANLEEQAQAIFKSWFVDFEPFQDGNFVESELGMIPEGWEVKELGDFMPVATGKKNANIANNNGEYPFFTCSQEIFKTNDYSFDANAILLAGNGDFNVKRYNGKFEAYQRTYVLIPNNYNHVGWLYNLIKYFLRDIVSGYKGSVINYITKGMIENFKIAVPRNIDELNVLSIFNDFELIISNIDNENKKIVEIRDALLPRLMSGEIDVSYIKIKGEEVKDEWNLFGRWIWKNLYKIYWRLRISLPPSSRTCKR